MPLWGTDHYYDSVKTEIGNEKLKTLEGRIIETAIHEGFATDYSLRDVVSKNGLKVSSIRKTVRSSF
jgi:hypothetical protein